MNHTEDIEGYLGDHAPPFGGGDGGGAAWDSGQLGSVVCSAAPSYLNSCTAYGAPEVFTLRDS